MDRVHQARQARDIRAPRTPSIKRSAASLKPAASGLRAITVRAMCGHSPPGSPIPNRRTSPRIGQKAAKRARQETPFCRRNRALPTGRKRAERRLARALRCAGWAWSVTAWQTVWPQTMPRPGGSGPGRVAEFSGCPSSADDLGVLGAAELAALGGETAGNERVHSVGIGRAKPPEQLAPAGRPVGGKGFGFHLNVAAILQESGPLRQRLCASVCGFQRTE